MDKNKQKIIAVSVGLVISILMIVVGVRIMQKRGSRASAPIELTCTISENEGTARWRNSKPEMMIIGYGATEGQYPFLAEESNAPEAIGNGSYQHEITFGPINQNSSYYVQVSGFEDAIAKCVVDDATSTQSIEVEAEEPEPTNPLTPTAVLIEEITPTPNDEEDDEETERMAPPTEDVDEFFSDNPSASILSCCNHFASEEDSNGNPYVGIAAVCISAYNEINSISTGTN